MEFSQIIITEAVLRYIAKCGIKADVPSKSCTKTLEDFGTVSHAHIKGLAVIQK